MSVMGLDLSLNSTGYCYRTPGDIITGRIIPNDLRGMERLYFNRHTLGEVLDEAVAKGGPISLVVIEGYAMGRSKSQGRVFNLGEWGGIARLVAYDRGIPMLIAPPAQLKMFATGNGGSAIKKPEVIQAIRDVWSYDVPQDDEADAFVLMHLGEAYLDCRIQRGIPQARKRALDGVEYLPSR